MNKPVYIKWGRLILYMLVALFLALAFWLWRGALPGDEPQRNGDVGDASEALDAAVRAYMESLPLEARVGQLIMVGFAGRTPPAFLLEAVSAGRVGGVILFRENLTGPEGTARISRQLQEAAAASEAAIPVLIATDEEGGPVSRVPGILPLPGNMALGAGGDLEQVQAVAAALGRQLRHLGINMNLAPVVDVNNNPANPIIGTRSFGDDPQQVGRLAAAMVTGLQSAGVAAVAKHFPGHGDTVHDSHLDLPVIPHDLERLRQLELPPFQAAAEAGVGAIMTAHILFTALDETGLPATLSPAIIDGLLRQELDYEGVVVTDALEMRAIADDYPAPVAAELALAAGVDLLLHPGGGIDAMTRQLVEAVEAGRLSRERIDEALTRVLSLKQSLGLLPPEPGQALAGLDLVPYRAEEPWPGDLGADRQRVWAVTLAAITVLGQAEELLPPADAGTVLVLAHRSQVPPQGRVPAWLPHGPQAPEWSADGTVAAQGETVMGHFLAARGYRVQEALFDSSPGAGQRAQLRQLAAGAGAVVVMTRNSHHFREQAALVAELLADGRTVRQVAMEGPYDRAANPEVAVFVASYHHGPLNTAAAAAVLAGEAAAGGTLPVSMPD